MRVVAADRFLGRTASILATTSGGREAAARARGAAACVHVFAGYVRVISAVRLDIDETRQNIEEARRVAIDRLIELERWVGRARLHVTNASLYELETDFQIIEQMAGITATQILRVLQESGLLRDAAHRLEDQRPNEVRTQRESDLGGDR